MKTKKFSITAILAVCFDNRELVHQFPASNDLIKFLGGKKEGEIWGDNEQERYDKAYELGKKILPEQYPWLKTDERIQKYGNRPVLDYEDLSMLKVVVKYRMMHDANNLQYKEGDDLEVTLP